MPARPQRQPQQARSIATRAALLDAAIACLVSEGYATVTTTDIVERAGVSRGAQIHHFPTKAGLMAAAIEHLFKRRLEEAVARFADAPAEVDLPAAIDLMWAMFEGPTFVAWAELWIAARTDVELAEAIVPVERWFTEETRLLFVEYFGAIGTTDPAVLELVRDVAFATMTGVAIQRFVPRGQRPSSDYLEVIKGLGASMLAPKVTTDGS